MTKAFPSNAARERKRPGSPRQTRAGSYSKRTRAPMGGFAAGIGLPLRGISRESVDFTPPVNAHRIVIFTAVEAEAAAIRKALKGFGRVVAIGIGGGNLPPFAGAESP